MAKVKGDLELDTLKLRNYTANPTAVEGAFIYNTTDNKYYGSTDGATWFQLSNAVPQTGSATPIGSVTPNFVGEIYVDTTNDNVFIAYGTANTEWRIVGGRYEQTFTAATTWTMTHGLGVQPNVTLLDSNGFMILPTSLEITTTQAIATFTSSVAGKMIASA